MKIVIDGNIGCGKSTLIKKISLDNNLSAKLFNEPLEDWDEWLKLFYSDMSKYSFGFQMRVLKSHLDKKKINDGIFERSPLSCQKVFGQLLFEDKMMTHLEWNLTEEFNYDYGWIPDIVFYLKCDPEICLKRIQNRSRDGENSISIDYLKRLDSKYNLLYLNPNANFKVIVIDGSQCISTVYQDFIKNLF